MSITMQCFLLCRSVTKEPRSNLQSIERFFDQLATSQLPTTVECALHVRFIAPDRPKCAVSILLESPTLAKGEVMAPISTNPDPNGVVQMTCKVKALELPHEGIYTFRLLIDGKIYSEYYLTVVKRRARSAPKPTPALSSE
jgi:hypothetical protein